jgi:phospholipid/cholesterol/gamma-HCH transport system substrate-binding protein
MAQKKRSMEIGTALFLLLGFFCVAFLMTRQSGAGLSLARSLNGYSVTARFDNIGGLRVGSPVKMSGVRVGRVDAITYDYSSYRAMVTLVIDHRYDRIPQDSDAAIQTSGLLGGNYIAITPGGSEHFVQQGTRLELTKSAFSIETLVNKLLASFVAKPRAEDVN